MIRNWHKSVERNCTLPGGSTIQYTRIYTRTQHIYVVAQLHVSYCLPFRQVPLTQILAGRVNKMSKKEAKEYFEDGPGRRVLAMDSLVVLLKQVCDTFVVCLYHV